MPGARCPAISTTFATRPPPIARSRVCGGFDGIGGEGRICHAEGREDLGANHVAPLRLAHGTGHHPLREQMGDVGIGEGRAKLDTGSTCRSDRIIAG